MEHAQHIIDSTQEIFSSMIMLDVKPKDPFIRKDERLINSISGIVGLAGTTKGMLAIHMANNAAMAVTTAFLGMEVDDINEDVRDAIGELANMLAGSLKSILDPGGGDIKLSMPSAVYGDEYSIDCLANASAVTVPFTFDGMNFMVELQLRKDS